MKVKSLAVLSLAAVGFLVGCKGDNSTDRKFVDNINKVIENSKDKINTTYDAEILLNNAGYTIENKLANKQLKLAFDIDEKCFIAMDGGSIKYGPSGYKANSNTYHLYQVVDNYDANSKYSQYLTSKFEGAEDLVVTTGLDMGANQNIKNIQYYSPIGVTKDIYLNTFCDYIDVYAPNDSIKHYGEANNIYIATESENIAFHEYGETSYIQTGAGDFYFEDECSADVFEIVEGSNVKIHQNKKAHVTGAINAEDVTTDAQIRYVEVDNATELKDAIEKTNKNFIRLVGDADVSYDLKAKISITRSLFIDLNGRSMKFENESQEEIDGENYNCGIVLKNSSSNPYINCFILDTQSRVYERSGIYMNDCSFIIHGDVKGDDEEKTNVILNFVSGKIHVIKNDVGKSAGFMVIGNTDVTGLLPGASRAKKNATLGMYGGYMVTERVPGSDPNKYSFKCIQPRGDGSNVYMKYGDITSGNFCISTQGIAYKSESVNYDKYSGYKIIIEGGNLVGGIEEVSLDYPYTPLFFSTTGYCKIKNVNVTGPTCINIKRGQLDIEGGTFNATGNKVVTEGGWDGSKTDGSVILAEVNNYYADAPVIINIDGVTMTSNNRYITNVVPYYKDGQSPNKPTLKIYHNGGQFIYKLPGSGVYEGTGVMVQTSLLTDPDVVVTADSNHGTWIQK